MSTVVDDPNAQRGPPRFHTWLEGPSALSQRELLALQCIAAGCSAKMAATVIGVSRETVRFHLTAARYKLNAKTTAHAACEAIRIGLIP